MYEVDNEMIIKNLKVGNFPFVYYYLIFNYARDYVMYRDEIFFSVVRKGNSSLVGFYE